MLHSRCNDVSTQEIAQSCCWRRGLGALRMHHEVASGYVKPSPETNELDELAFIGNLEPAACVKKHLAEARCQFRRCGATSVIPRPLSGVGLAA